MKIKKHGDFVKGYKKHQKCERSKVTNFLSETIDASGNSLTVLKRRKNR